MRKKGGSLRIVSAKAKCKKRERAIAWNQRGVQGVQGAQGAQGSTGEAGPQGPATGPAGGDLTGTYPDPTIAPAKVNTGKLADVAVTTPKLGPGAVTNSKLGSSSVDPSKIIDNSITGAEVQNRGLSDGDIGSPAQLIGADLPSIGANSCIDLALNFGAWDEVGEIVFASARDGRYGPSGIVFTPLVVATAGTASGRVCNITGAAIDPAPEDVLTWSIRQ